MTLFDIMLERQYVSDANTQGGAQGVIRQYGKEYKIEMEKGDEIPKILQSDGNTTDAGWIMGQNVVLSMAIQTGELPYDMSYGIDPEVAMAVNQSGYLQQISVHRFMTSITNMITSLFKKNEIFQNSNVVAGTATVYQNMSEPFSPIK